MAITKTKNKKTTGKTAKKPIVKPKLIEGKYSHKFLARIEPPTGEVLDKLKITFNKKTLNGTVITVINSYSHLQKLHNELQAEHSALKQQMNKASNILFGLKDNFKQLSDLKLIDIPFDDEPALCDYCDTKLVNGHCKECD